MASNRVLLLSIFSVAAGTWLPRVIGVFLAEKYAGEIKKYKIIDFLSVLIMSALLSQEFVNISGDRVSSLKSIFCIVLVALLEAFYRNPLISIVFGTAVYLVTVNYF